MQFSALHFKTALSFFERLHEGHAYLAAVSSYA